MVEWPGNTHTSREKKQEKRKPRRERQRRAERDRKARKKSVRVGKKILLNLGASSLLLQIKKN